MPRSESCRPLLVFLLAALMALVGCNRQTTVTVTGTIQKNGQPIALSNTGILQITLVPDGGPEAENFTPKIAECDRATGQFQVLEVKPGRYKIGVEQLDPNPQSDKLNAAFRFDVTKIVRDIDGKAPLVIDLAKPGS